MGSPSHFWTLPPLPLLRAGVGWQQRCITRHLLRKQGNQVAVFDVFLLYP